MPITEIINEIDAYLLRLRQARELMLELGTEAPLTRQARRETKVMVKQAKPAFSSLRQADENKSRSKHSVAHLKKIRKRVDMSARASSSVARQASDSEHLADVEQERMLQQNVPITRLPARRRSGLGRSLLHRAAKRALVNNLDAMKPAIALARPLETKIVVVSAQQVQREREQARRPVVLRPRLPAAGLSGRSAFEALFKDETESSKASGH
jgi:hypothetical protein